MIVKKKIVTEVGSKYLENYEKKLSSNLQFLFIMKMLNMDKMKIFQIKCLNEQKIIMEMLKLYFDFDMVMKKLFSHIINKMMKKVYLELLNTEVK
ncbi:MAG: hypothetical protein EZS28_022732, partial [Streblomastix strix]